MSVSNRLADLPEPGHSLLTSYCICVRFAVFFNISAEVAFGTVLDYYHNKVTRLQTAYFDMKKVVIVLYYVSVIQLA